MKRKLVDHLVNGGLVERKQVQRCVLRASMNERSVIDEMTEHLDIDQRALASSMAEFWGFEFWDRESVEMTDPKRDVISEQQARNHGVLPVGGQDDVFRLAVYDVEMARPVIEEIRNESGLSPSIVIAPRKVVEDAIERLYDGASNGGQGSGMLKKTSPGATDAATASRGVLKKKKSPSNSGNTAAKPANADDAQPTRQVDLATDDNPFMDLVQQTADDSETSIAEESSSIDSSLGESSASIPEDDEEADFFGEFQDSDEFRQMVEESWSDAEAADDDEGIGDVDGALDDFDAELDDMDSAGEETGPLSSSASVNWGEHGDGQSQQEPGMLAGSGRSGSQSGASGIFPVDRGQSGVFSFSGAEDDEDLTLAEVVDRQRRIIDKLEREIEYQKGILQTMAELLVEARVLSRSKLKKRLKAFKEEQRKRYK